MAIHKHNDWIIHSEGGFITMKRFVAHKEGHPFSYSHWEFRLRDCKNLCDARDAGKPIPDLFLKSLY